MHDYYSSAPRASRRDDTARLLDPDYTSPVAFSPAPYKPVTAYVDHQGALHDPDFRHFPIIQHDRWRLNEQPAEDDDEYDFSPIRRHTPVYPSYTPYPSYASTGYTYPSSTKASFVQAHPPSAHAYNSPTTSSSSSPSSVDSAESALSAAARSTRSAFDDRACRVFKRRRWSHDGPPLSHRDLSDVADDEDAASPILHEDLDDEEDAGEDTRVQQENKPRPTCTHALRREWQTLCLRVEFRIFHLQRRVRSIRESRRRAGVGG